MHETIETLAIAIKERLEWHGIVIPWGFEYRKWPNEYLDLTGKQIRELRSKASTQAEIYEANHPRLIGLEPSPWTWRKLISLLDEVKIATSAYDYKLYDPDIPNRGYNNDRIVLKELFAGSAFVEYELGTQVDSIAQGDQTVFEGRAIKYLTSIVCQILQTYEQAKEAKAKADLESAESTTESE